MDLNENHISIVKEYAYDNLLFKDIDFILNICINDCYKNYFQPIRNICSYIIDFTNISNDNIINLTISDSYLTINELKKKLKNGRNNGYIFSKINKLSIKFYDYLSQTNIHHYYKFHCPLLIRQILKMSRDYNSIQRISNIYHNVEFYIFKLQIYKSVIL